MQFVTNKLADPAAALEKIWVALERFTLAKVKFPVVGGVCTPTIVTPPQISEAPAAATTWVFVNKVKFSVYVLGIT